MKQNTIQNWAAEDKPAHKLMMKGTASLTTSELITLITSTTEPDASKELLKHCKNDIQQLANLSVRDIINLKIPGIGEAKAITIIAAFELGQRRNIRDSYKKVIVTSRDAADFLRAQFQNLRHEIFAVLFLNRANKIMHQEIISSGGITGTVADPRIILKKALENNAVSIILSHNHPSGSLKPSRADEDLTEKIKHAASYFDVKVLDHVIVSEEGYYSFADEGLL